MRLWLWILLQPWYGANIAVGLMEKDDDVL